MTRGRKSSKSTSRSKSRTSRKGSDFAYLMQRKGLRMMRRYYKEKFENCGIFDDYKQQIRSCTIENLDQAIHRFITNEFPYMLDYSEYWQYTRLNETLKTLILSDRYNKSENITEGLEFGGVRSVLYSFNTRNLINFFSDKCYSFLFYHYFDTYGHQDIDGQNDVDPVMLLKEMQELYKEAEKYIKISMDNYKRDWCQPEPLMYSFDEEELDYQF